MTGLVVVSHSRVLADAAVALASEMVRGSRVTIAVAAGLDATTFGTDATAIVEAFTQADDGTGVVVLMDLGSAVLSAEMALDMIDADLRERIILCPAPLVEGLVVAAVAAAGGASPAEVAAEAMGSLAAKQSHVGSTHESSETESAELDGTAHVAVVKVTNPHGLHARPAARLVQEARLYDARIQLRNLDTGSGPVPATSLSRVATLGALCGHRVEVAATGSQAREAVEHVVALAERHFDETAPTIERTPTAPGRTSGPLPASPGIAIGPVLVLHTKDVEITDSEAEDSDSEWRKVRGAIAEVRREIQRVRVRTEREVGEAEARIFDAHLMLIDDTDLLDEVHKGIREGRTAVRAWIDAVTVAEAELAVVPDPYLRARADDVHAVGQQVARTIVGVTPLDVDGDGVLVADDLTPAQVAELDTSRIRGLVLASSSPTGHCAILARSRGIPAVVAAGTQVLGIPAGQTLAIDGTRGLVYVGPDDATLRELAALDESTKAAAAAALASSGEAAFTSDHVEVKVGANLGSVADAELAAANGADLSGLVRTEFLYLDRLEPPTVDEQVAIYRNLAASLGGRRLTLRTLDVGGDKPLAYAAQPPEDNPFLGLRGIRLSLAEPRLLQDQLLAIVRVAHETPVSVMFPMVTTVDELTEALAHLDRAVELEGRGRPAGLEVGIMVEVPAAALRAAVFVPHVDFLSIGTNDLTQYTLAAERGNAAVAALADPLDPAVLRLIDQVCRAADERCLVAVCGELAADESATALLVALGVRELSVAPSAVPTVKQAVRAVVSAASSGLIEAALAAAGPQEVRDLLRPG